MIRASKIRIQNILGVDDCEISPGHVTIIHGQNGKGKTSRLEAIKSALVGSKMAFLKRIGAEQGETVITFSDGMTSRRVVSDGPKGGTFEVKHPVYGKLPAARTAIDGMLDAVSIDPQRFMDGKDEERLAILTEALKIAISTEQLVGATGLPESQVLEIISSVLGLTPLELVNYVRKHLAAVRTDTNRSVREKSASITQLKETLAGLDMTQDWSAVITAARKTVASRQAELVGAVEAVTLSRNKGQDNAREAYLDARRSKRADCDRRIKEIEAEFTKECERASAELDESVGCFQVLADGFIAADRERLQPQIDVAAADLVRAEAAQERVSSEAKTIALIQRFEDELAFSTGYAETLTAAIDGIDVLKSSLLGKIPIAGVDVRDGQLFVGGVPFPVLNRQQKVSVCIEVAKLRAKAGNIGVVVFDNLECLDTEHMEEFVRQALETDLQWIVGRVSDAPGVNVQIINREGVAA